MTIKQLKSIIKKYGIEYVASYIPCSKRAIYYWLSGEQNISKMANARLKDLTKGK